MVLKSGVKVYWKPYQKRPYWVDIDGGCSDSQSPSIVAGAFKLKIWIEFQY